MKYNVNEYKMLAVDALTGSHEDYLSIQTEIDLTEFFNQYLRDTRIPVLEFSVHNGELKYRWTNIVKNFDMPVIIEVGNKEQWIRPNSEWQTKIIPSGKMPIEINRNFYATIKRL